METKFMVRSLTVAALTLATATLPSTQTAKAQSPGISEPEAHEIAKEAYVYAYPLMLMDAFMRQGTNYAEPTGIVTQAPYNQFSHARAFPPADFKAVVRPNVDTLYSSANLDLGAEPVVLTVPATDRYFMLPLLSAWTDVFAVPGSRTTGRSTAREFLLVGPTWRGEVPSGLEIIRSPTRLVGIGGRTQTNGVSDYDTVHRIQAGYKLTPLSERGKGNYTPPKNKVDPAIDMKTPPPVQIEKMDAATYFARFAELLKDNPPGPFDYPMIHRLQRIGFNTGQSFDVNAARPQVKQAIERATTDGKASVAKAEGGGRRRWEGLGLRHPQRCLRCRLSLSRRNRLVLSRRKPAAGRCISVAFDR